jgi:hypothetical protein
MVDDDVIVGVVTAGYLAVKYAIAISALQGRAIKPG